MIGSNRAQTADREVFRHIGCDPESYGIVVVKSAIHFLADFEPIAERVLFAVAAGQNPCKLTEIPYKKLRSGAAAWGHRALRLSGRNIKALALTPNASW